MNSLIEKIDAEIKKYEIDDTRYGFYYRQGMKHIKNLILSEHEEPCEYILIDDD